jgi:D-alanine-D-alanine ligase
MSVSNNEVGSAPSLMWERQTKREDVTAGPAEKWDPTHQKRVGLKSGPAKLDAALAREIDHTSKRIYRLLGLSGCARLDYRLTDRRRLFLLEANPNPQIARKEDFADSAEYAGVNYEELLQKLVILGLSYVVRP